MLTARNSIAKVLCLLLALLVAGSAIAQNQGRPRSWKKGQLRLEDFGTAPSTGNEKSHLEYAITYTPSGITEGMHTYRYCRTGAVMYPAASWMTEERYNEAELTYNQALFDLVEIHRRQMQREALLLTKDKQYKILQVMTTDRLDREVRELQVATDYGSDSMAVEHVRQLNRQWLNDNPGVRPEFAQKKYWWGIGMELGALIPTGSVGREFSASVGTMSVSGALGWNRHGFYYHQTGGSVYYREVQDDYISNMTASIIDVSFGYGFTLFDRERYSITPYVALGMTNYDWYYGDTYTFGVIGKYHFHHWHSISNILKNKASCLSVSATGRLSVSYVDMYDGFSGLSFGLHVGLAFKWRKEHVEW